eukprot:2464402-Prymnesium_polylepis.1
MDPRHSGVALTSPCGRRVAVDVVLGSLAECRPEGGATGVSTLGVGGNSREWAANCRMPVRVRARAPRAARLPTERGRAQAEKMGHLSLDQPSS